jgi:hypothetical protein
MLQNNRSVRNFKSRRSPSDVLKTNSNWPPKPSGQRGRALIDRVVAERHFGKHTGLPPPAQKHVGRDMTAW